MNNKKKQLQKHYAVVCDPNPYYSTYKNSFKFIAKFMGLPSDQIILENMVFSKDKKDKDQEIVAVKYSKGLIKVEIPEGVRLIHVSPADNIQNLIPSFKSKVTGKYMYPSKRVFFTVAKDIKPNQAGLEGQRLTRYTPKNEIRTAYIDPTYSEYKNGSVYVETIEPIPVVTFHKKMLDVFKNIIPKNNPVKESAESLEEAGIKNLIANVNQWKTGNEVHSINKYVSNNLTDQEYEKLKNDIDIMKTTESYEEYLKAFKRFCYFCNIAPRGVILRKYELTKGKDNKNSIIVEYANNTKKISLPEGTILYHMSKVDNIKELIPTFRGKSERGYLYDKPRIYFTIRKNMPKFLADYKINQKLSVYVSKVNIKDVYVDPLVWNYAQGAVYIETNKRIPVEKIDSDSEVKKLEDKYEEEE